MIGDRREHQEFEDLLLRQAEIAFREVLAAADAANERPPALHGVTVRHDVHRRYSEFDAHFGGAQNYRWRVHWYRQIRGYDYGESRCPGLEQLYSRLYEDHLIERETRAARRRVERLLELDPDGGAVRDAQEDYFRLRRHVEHYHGRPEPSPEHQLISQRMRRADEDLRRSFYGDPVDTEAEKKGLALLKSWLTPEQAKQYEADKAFEVTGGETGKRYRIRHGRQMNIEELDQSGKRVCGWCFLPQGQLVVGDVMLAQKVSLETNERAALAIANRF